MYKVFSAFLLIVALLISIQERANGQVTTEDSLALVTLYNSTGGHQWTQNTNWLTTSPVSQWYGVMVKDGRVTELQLRNNNLEGALPKELGDLKNLIGLLLDSNSLTGKIPDELGALSNLTQLSLYSNNLTGGIPSSIGNLAKLKYFEVGNNQLEGTIPDNFVGCDSLTWVWIGGNNFSGSIPPSLTYLKRLRSIFAHDNNFTTMPDFSLTPEIAYIAVVGNKLTFGSLEPNVGVPIFVYHNQDSIQLFAEKQGANVRLWVRGDGKSNKYKWYKNNNVISGSDSAIIINETENTADYRCEVTNSALPDLTLYTLPASATLDVAREDAILASVEVTPSIVREKVTVSYVLEEPSHVTISICDATNKLVRSVSDERKMTGMHSQSVDCSSLASGYYSVFVGVNGRTIMRKIVVNK